MLSELAAKQKRILSWSELLAAGGVPPDLKERFEKEIEEFGKLLVACWEEGKIGPENGAAIADAERRLEQLAEDTRLQN